MNREIKFRAFDPSKQEIYMDCLIGNNGKLVALEYESDGCGSIDCSYQTDSNGDYEDAFILMQFTGLKDKNGIDIYEGDIISFTKHSGYLLDSFIGNVIYITENACFGYEKGGYQYPFNEHHELQYDFLNHCIVIGNIYENIELLKN